MCPQRPALCWAMQMPKSVCVSKGQESMRPQPLVTCLAGSPRPQLQHSGRRGVAKECPALLTSGLWSAGAFR